MHGKGGVAVGDAIKFRGSVAGIRGGNPSGKQGASGGYGSEGVGLMGDNRGIGGTPGPPRNGGGKKGGPGRNGAPG